MKLLTSLWFFNGVRECFAFLSRVAKVEALLQALVCAYICALAILSCPYFHWSALDVILNILLPDDETFSSMSG